LIFLDESGVSTQMTRLYARCTGGARIHETTPDGRWKILTILGAISTRGMIATMTIEAATDREIFLAYLVRMTLDEEDVSVPVHRDTCGVIPAAGQARLSAFPSMISVSDPAAADLSAAVQFISSLITDCGLPHLPHDLGFILNKANCADPSKVYASAYSLAADLRSFLDRKPVSTRRASVMYHATLLVRRRPELFFPAMILAAAVLAATLYSVAMELAARRLQNHAQTRLRQMQQLTYSLESDIYEPVSKLPNSKAVSETLIRWAAESLDGLAAHMAFDENQHPDAWRPRLNLVG
jgi:hypothetical protein